MMLMLLLVLVAVLEPWHLLKAAAEVVVAACEPANMTAIWLPVEESTSLALLISRPVGR